MEIFSRNRNVLNQQKTEQIETNFNERNRREKSISQQNVTAIRNKKHIRAV